MARTRPVLVDLRTSLLTHGCSYIIIKNHETNQWDQGVQGRTQDFLEGGGADVSPRDICSVAPLFSFIIKSLQTE